MAGINGWLLVYLIGSVPLALFYSAGLSGWFLDYHLGLFAGIFFVLAVLLVLVVLQVPSAPAWNIAALWVGGGLTTLRLLIGALSADEARLQEAGMILAAIVSISIAWSVVWTMYFLISERVAKTFT